MNLLKCIKTSFEDKTVPASNVAYECVRALTAMTCIEDWKKSPILMPVDSNSTLRALWQWISKKGACCDCRLQCQIVWCLGNLAVNNAGIHKTLMMAVGKYLKSNIASEKDPVLLYHTTRLFAILSKGYSTHWLEMQMKHTKGDKQAAEQAAQKMTKKAARQLMLVLSAPNVNTAVQVNLLWALRHLFDTHKGGLADLLEKEKGLVYIENLCLHENFEVQEAAKHLIETYFPRGEGVHDENSNPNTRGNTHHQSNSMFPSRNDGADLANNDKVEQMHPERDANQAELLRCANEVNHSLEGAFLPRDLVNPIPLDRDPLNPPQG
mmetsp:Transcript_9739/g.22890  ORF Transcript_9739/g.22890 Transcript_9739/m.22890 type:complete len:323 (-) Transcript_9739:3477-4445(-)